MTRFKLIYLLLLTYSSTIAESDNANDKIDALKPPDKLVLQKSAPYQQPETFLSRISSWIFPFGATGRDLQPEEGRFSAPQYLPPPSAHQTQKKCNPCNQVPWVPVLGQHKAIINFGPPPSQQYGPPVFKPKPESLHHGPLALPSSNYGPPLFPNSNYGPPSLPNSNYGPPSLPNSNYGPPSLPNSNYGPPSLPNSNYGPPSLPNSNYGPPSLPNSNYGPPSLPNSNYGPPSLPNSNYGPPSRPNSNYGLPSFSNTNSGRPSLPNSIYSAPSLPKPSYGTPSFRTPKIRPPVQGFGPPIKTFAPTIEHLRPPPYENNPPIKYGPPVTFLKPVKSRDFGTSIGMLPPPVQGGAYHSIQPTNPSTNQEYSPPPPPPSDSYGSPVTGPNTEFLLRPEYLPIEQQPQSTNFDLDQPIPLPNLSTKPVVPLHEAQDFKDSLPQQNEVQVVPSIQIADYLSSVEHPINVVQSPLVEVLINNQEERDEGHQSGKDVEEQFDLRPNAFYQNNGPNTNSYPINGLSTNPIVVPDTHTASSQIHPTVQNNTLNSVSTRGNRTFTVPPLDYSDWTPSWSNSASSTVGPPPSTWLFPVTTTKRPKQVQIIVPYVNHKTARPFKVVPNGGYTTLLPVYSPPPLTPTNNAWNKFVDDFKLAESKKVTATAFTPPPSTSTNVYNIRDLLQGTNEYHHQPDSLPFDVVSLQNNIDDWTQQEFTKAKKTFKQMSTTRFVPSKKIPEDYFTTPKVAESATGFDYEPASSNQDDHRVQEDIASNFIYAESTERPSTTERSVETTVVKELWDVTSVSPITKEKIYIVTPQTPTTTQMQTSTPAVTGWSLPPKVISAKNTSFVTPKFLVRLEPENEASREKLQQSFSPLTVVFSEWPHLINNLQTTTTTVKPTSKHPLLGLMDLSAYTPPPNSTVQTISGHSRVVSVVTPASVTERKPK